jgi:hypothetical protein
MSDTEVFVGDTAPAIDVELADGETGAPLDLTAPGTSVQVVVLGYDGVEKFSGPGTVDPDTPGRVFRPWQSSETTDPFKGIARFKVTTTAGTRTYPTNPLDQYTVEIIDDTVLPAPLIDPDRLADEYGLGPLTGPQRRRLAAALRSITGIVADYLGRPLSPQTFTEQLPDYVADDSTVAYPPVLEVLSQTYDPATDLVTTVYRGGIDATQIETVRSFIERAAIQDYFSRLPSKERLVQTVSVEGQSKTYMPVPTDAGGKIVLDSLMPWRNPSLQQRNLGVYSAPRPHDPDARLDNVPGSIPQYDPASWPTGWDPLGYWDNL